MKNYILKKKEDFGDARNLSIHGERAEEVLRKVMELRGENFENLSEAKIKMLCEELYLRTANDETFDDISNAYGIDVLMNADGHYNNIIEYTDQDFYLVPATMLSVQPETIKHRKVISAVTVEDVARWTDENYNEELIEQIFKNADKLQRPDNVEEDEAIWYRNLWKKIRGEK